MVEKIVIDSFHFRSFPDKRFRQKENDGNKRKRQQDHFLGFLAVGFKFSFLGGSQILWRKRSGKIQPICLEYFFGGWSGWSYMSKTQLVKTNSIFQVSLLVLDASKQRSFAMFLYSSMFQQSWPNFFRLKRLVTNLLKMISDSFSRTCYSTQEL